MEKATVESAGGGTKEAKPENQSALASLPYRKSSRISAKVFRALFFSSFPSFPSVPNLFGGRWPRCVPWRQLLFQPPEGPALAGCVPTLDSSYFEIF
jgi:hypothetical protein